MHNYEHRSSGKQPWRQCDREEALTLLGRYGTEAETVLRRIDGGETVTSATCQLRKFDPSTAPFSPRRELPIEPDGDIIYA